MSTAAFADFEVELAAVELPDIVRYAGAAGDFNPSHYDRNLAQGAGFETNFAQGMFTAGLLGVAVADRFGPDRIVGFGVRFVAPLWCGDVPIVSAAVGPVTDGIVALELTVRVGSKVVLTGWAKILAAGAAASYDTSTNVSESLKNG